MVAERVDRACSLGLTFTAAALGVVLGADAGAAATVGTGAGGAEATGTALWQAAIVNIPAKPIAVRICCLIIFVSSCGPFYAAVTGAQAWILAHKPSHIDPSLRTIP